jgi:hypothetical protein
MCAGSDDGKKSEIFSARMSGEDVEGLVVVASDGDWVCKRSVTT